MTEPAYIEQGATFNETRTHRYTLVRRWADGPMVLWIMLNPSTADETELDPTLRRCLGFTMDWIKGYDTKYGAFEVCNLYGFRSTHPRYLFHPRPIFDNALDIVGYEPAPTDPVGPENDAYILERAKCADLVMVGWGKNAKPERERKVAQMLADDHIQPHALRLIKNGSPEHPLYLPAALLPRPWLCKGLR